MTTFSPLQIGKVAYDHGFRGDGLVTAIAVALAESGGQVEVVNSIGCVGLWQINQPVHVSAHPTWTRAWCQNASNNAAAAAVLSGTGSNWGPWTTYTSGAYKAHLAVARTAAASSASPSGSDDTGKTKQDPKKPVFHSKGGGPGSGGKQGSAKNASIPNPKVEAYDPRVRLGRIYVHGGKMDTDFADQVTAASVNWSTTSVCQLQLTMEDPGFAIFRSAHFEKGTAILYREPADDPNPEINLSFRVASLVTGPGASGNGGLTINARDETTWRLKKRTGAKVIKKASPTDFVIAECKAIKANVVAQPSPKRGHVARDVKGKGKEESQGAEKPSSWTTFQRLASELGYVVYAYAGTVYFGKPTWLIAQDKTPMYVALPQDGAPLAYATRVMPSITVSDDADVPVSIDGIEVEKSRFGECRPGGALRLRGLPPYNDDYLTLSMDLPLLGTGPIVLTAATPKNPPKQPPAKVAAKGGAKAGHDPSNTGTTPPGTTTTTAPTGGKSAAAFVATAISASNASYVFGAEASVSDATPSALDCSELVQWALGRIGINYVDGSSAQYAASIKISLTQGFGTKGALLHKDGHIGISMGNGQSVEARNPTDGVGIFNAHDIAWTGAGLVPGLAY